MRVSMKTQCTFWDKNLNDEFEVWKRVCLTIRVPGSLLVPRAVAMLKRGVQTEFHHYLAP